MLLNLHSLLLASQISWSKLQVQQAQDMTLAAQHFVSGALLLFNTPLSDAAAVIAGCILLMCSATCSDIKCKLDPNKKTDLKPSIVENGLVDGQQTPAADNLLQHFVGSATDQAMRRAPDGSAANHQDAQTGFHFMDGKLQHQPSPSERLRAKLLETDLGAV